MDRVSFVLCQHGRGSDAVRGFNYSYIIVVVPRNVRRDPSSTVDLAGLEALSDTCVIVLVETLTLNYLCRMNTCLVDSAVSLNPLGLL